MSASIGTSRQASAGSKSRSFSHATGSRTSSARCPAAAIARTRFSWCSSAPPRTNGFWAPHTTTSTTVAAGRRTVLYGPMGADTRPSTGEPPPPPVAARIAAVERLPMERVNPSATFWRGFGRAAREVYDYRELLTNLVRKELKVKYKDSILGFLWSLLRPMFLLAVYYIAIGKFLGTNFELFPIFLFSGLVAWSLFTDVLGGCTGTVVGNGGLIKKVYFPRELLPLSVMGAALVNFAMQMVVLVAAVLLFNGTLHGQQPLLLPLAFVVLVLFAASSVLLWLAQRYFARAQGNFAQEL